MKIKKIILGITASLLLPLAGANAGLAPADEMDVQSGSAGYLGGQAVEDEATRRGRWRRHWWRRGGGNDGSGDGRRRDDDTDSDSDSDGDADSNE